MSSAIQSTDFPEYSKSQLAGLPSTIIEKIRCIWDSLKGDSYFVKKQIVSTCFHGTWELLPDFSPDASNAIRFFSRIRKAKDANALFSTLFWHLSDELFTSQFKSWTQDPNVFIERANYATRLGKILGVYPFLPFRLLSIESIKEDVAEELLKNPFEQQDTLNILLDKITLEGTFSLSDLLFIVRNNHIGDVQKALDKAKCDKQAIRNILPDLYLSHNDPVGLEKAVEILLLQDTRDSKEQARTLQLFLDLIKLKAATPKQIAAYKTAEVYKSFQEDLSHADTPDKMRQIEARLQAAIEAGTTYQVLKAREALPGLFADQGDAS